MSSWCLCLNDRSPEMPQSQSLLLCQSRLMYCAARAVPWCQCTNTKLPWHGCGGNGVLSCTFLPPIAFLHFSLLSSYFVVRESKSHSGCHWLSAVAVFFSEKLASMVCSCPGDQLTATLCHLYSILFLSSA